MPQCIENLGVRDEKIRQHCGTPNHLFSSYIHEFMSGNLFQTNLFGHIYKCNMHSYNIICCMNIFV